MQIFSVFVILVVFLTVVISVPVGCGGGASGNGGVLSIDSDSNTLGEEVAVGLECATLQICHLDCPQGKAKNLNVAGSPLAQFYDAVCTTPKRTAATAKIKELQADKIADLQDLYAEPPCGMARAVVLEMDDDENVLSEKVQMRMQQQCVNGQPAGPVRAGAGGAKQIADTKTVGSAMTAFAETVSRLCEEGAVTDTTPRDVLETLWNDYKGSTKMAQHTKDVVKRLDSLAKDMLHSTIKIWSRRCPCADFSAKLTVADRQAMKVQGDVLCGVNPAVQVVPQSQKAVAPPQKPVVQPLPVQKPVVQPLPVQKPVVQPPKVQKPIVQPPKVQKPVVHPPKVQKPVVQPKKPVVQPPKPIIQKNQPVNRRKPSMMER